jgi:hypothetical protein
MATEAEEKEPAYGEWHSCTPEELAAEDKLYPGARGEEVEPGWSEGVPSRMRRLCGSPPFHRNGVNHRHHAYYRAVELCWTRAHPLSFLRNNKRYLPSSKHSGEWSGVYRLFAQNTPIDRCCGKDTTGTLYIGLAGSGRQSWSILRYRVKAIVDQDHHAFGNWHASELVRRKFPWENMFVQWACTGKSFDHKGEDVAEAVFAEAFLLNTYNEAYGEYPPWNQRG